jgi:exodeoxyribonuclease V alpha subunit
LNIEGTVKKVKFLNELTGWGVINFIREDGTTFIAKGKVGPQLPGYKLSIDGRWIPNARGGGQVFDISNYRTMPPSTSEGIYLFLTSGLFKGMTRKIATALVDLYGARTLRLLDSDINVLSMVPGVGAKTFMKIRDSYQDAKPQQEKIFTLTSVYRFNLTEALLIVNKFPENALKILENAPFSMYRRLDKIPFVRFDQIIMGKGCDHLDPQRIREVILHQMKNCYQGGHTLMLEQEVLKNSLAYLNLDRYLVENEMQFLLDKRRLFLSDSPRGPVLQSKWFYTAEKEIANRLSMIIKAPASKSLHFNDTDERLNKLKSHQRRAVVAPFHHKVSIVTGRPGAGKTTLLRTMLDLVESQNLSILAVSPTGKAAQRLREVTSRDCSTIHRALGATHMSDEFIFNDLNPLNYDVIVVDETSMLDTSILRALLRAAPATTRIVLIGDVEQLPSVAPGAVFRDLIDSGCFPVYWLTEVLRITKADGSLPTPLLVANGIRTGTFPTPPNDDEWGYYPTQNNQETIVRVQSLIAELQKQGVGYNDVQVFSPVNNDELGVDKLNAVVKKCFFPLGTPEIEVGDKIMQRENNYELSVFNGDIGIVKEIYDESKRISADDPVMLADMSGSLVEFCKKDLYHITLAYTITGHKSQGSEYPHVIITIPDHHFSLMDRFWLYTLVTRCQVKAHVVGNPNVIKQIVRSRKSHERQTLMLQKLRRFLPVLNEVHK